MDTSSRLKPLGHQAKSVIKQIENSTDNISMVYRSIYGVGLELHRLGRSGLFVLCYKADICGCLFKYLSNYLMYCHEVWFTRSCLSLDEL